MKTKNKKNVANNKGFNQQKSTENRASLKQSGGELEIETTIEEQIKLFASLIADHLIKEHHAGDKKDN